MFKRIGKGIKKFVNNRIQTCKEILTDNKNRLIIGLVMVGAGAGLIASAYITVPA